MSFAGYQLRPPGGETLGVLALFSTRPITPEEDIQLDTVSVTAAQVICAAQVEEALRDSEAKFRRLVENLRERYFFYRRDRNGVFTYVSPSISNILGYSPDDFQIHYTQYLTDSRINQEVLRHSQLSILGALQPPYEAEIRHKDSSLRVLEISETPVLDEEGDVVAVEGIAADITERKRADEALRESEVRLRAITDSAQDAILMMDPEGSVSYWNPAAESMLGYTREEAMGRNLHELLAPARYLEAHRKAFPEFVRTGQGAAVGKTLELQALRKDGEEITTSLSLSAVRLGDGWHAVGILRDITDLKRAETERARLAAAVEQGAESIVITDTNGIILYVNPAFERITGYSRQEALGQTPRILKSGLQDAEFYRNLWGTIGRGEVWAGRMINRKRDGSLCHQDVAITPVRDEAGTTVNFVSVQRDVTQEMHMEAQLRQAQKLEAVGSLAAGIAHEINTPIQFVGDNTHFLSDAFAQLIAMVERSRRGLSLSASGDADTGESAEGSADSDLEYLCQEIPRAIADSLDGIGHVAKIVRAMKEFSHPDKGEKAPADINGALRTTLTIARNELKYVADVVTDFDETLPSVHCNLGGMNQVFLNILVNAAHAIADVVGDGSAGKGTITVSTRREGDSVVIAISDTGTGIPPEARDRIFDPFFTSKAVGRGTGQGLTIARSEVVDKHGGSITFETEVGKGTTFYIRLPIHAPEPAEVS